MLNKAPLRLRFFFGNFEKTSSPKQKDI